MEKFEYYNPVKVVFGEGTLETVGSYANQYGKKALLVTYTECGFFAETIETIKKSPAHRPQKGDCSAINFNI